MVSLLVYSLTQPRKGYHALKNNTMGPRSPPRRPGDAFSDLDGAAWFRLRDGFGLGFLAKVDPLWALSQPKRTLIKKFNMESYDKPGFQRFRVALQLTTAPVLFSDFSARPQFAKEGGNSGCKDFRRSLYGP